MRHQRISIIALLGVSLVAATGCVSFPTPDKMKVTNPFSKKDKEPEPYPNPVKMAVTWTPDTLTTAGKRPTRGFGARIFFYNDKTQAVPVEGELTVVAYEETLNPGEPSRVRRFGFTKEQFTTHFSQSDLGASYSVWIPWDVEGGMGERITLVPSFQSVATKTPIQGSPTAVLLPGPMPEQDAINKARQLAKSGPQSDIPRVPANAMTQQVRQAGFAPGTEPASGNVVSNPGDRPTLSMPPRVGMNTLTIPTGPRFGRK